MKETVAWLNAAIAAGKDEGGGMIYYKINEKTISASDGKLTACTPWKWGGKYFVPGAEFEKILDRLPGGEPEIVEIEGGIKLKSGRFSGSIETMELTEWDYPGIAKVKWQKLPKGFLELLEALRPFTWKDENPVPWAACIALEGGLAYATDGVAIAGGSCPGLNCKALLPDWAVDFLLSRRDGLSDWTWDDHFMAFRWSNGAWMRTQLIIGQFPEKAAAMVRASSKMKVTQKVDQKFLEAVERVGELASDTIIIYKDRIEARFGKAIVEDGIRCEVPKGHKCSIFGARYLLPVLKAAESWSPGTWPEPSPWKGKGISGYIAGRGIGA